MKKKKKVVHQIAYFKFVRKNETSFANVALDRWNIIKRELKDENNE